MKHAKRLVTAICMMIIFTPLASGAASRTIPAVPTETGTVSLEMSTDKNEYTTGDIIQLTIAMEGDASIDIYMTASFPDGSFASYTATMMPDATGSIVPILKNIPLAAIAGAYTLPLPVIPLWPEGTSEIWVVFVKAGKNPMMSSNWLAEDMVSFTVTQNDNVEPLLDIENKTFTAPLGDMGTLQITFSGATADGDTITGTVEGSIDVKLPTGETRQRTVTGTYTYTAGTLTLHIEDEQDFSMHIVLTVNEDGTLTGSYETSDGKTGEIEFDLAAALP